MKISQSKKLRSVLYIIWDGLSQKYRDDNDFEKFYEMEMKKIIDNYKDKI